MRRQHPGDLVESYLENAVKGDRRPAIRVALDLFDSGVPEEQVVVGLLAAAQREVGERWHRNELTVADEHIATGVAAAALDALMNESDPSGREGHTVVACAEGDWHALAAEMFGESLRSHGVTVTVLGASTPAELVAEFITRRDGESLAISCSVPTPASEPSSVYAQTAPNASRSNRWAPSPISSSGVKPTLRVGRGSSGWAAR